MSVVNQIPELNLNNIFINLQKIIYKFQNNKNSINESLNDRLEFVNTDIEHVNENIKNIETGKLASTSELQRMGVDTSGCNVSDVNKRFENILSSVKDRKSELVLDKEEIKKDIEDNNLFYDRIINLLRNIITNLFELLKRLVETIGRVLTTIETAIISLSTLPFGSGLSGVSTLGFVQQMLQTKIYEPVNDTVDQQELYNS